MALIRTVHGHANTRHASRRLSPRVLFFDLLTALLDAWTAWNAARLRSALIARGLRDDVPALKAKGDYLD